MRNQMRPISTVASLPMLGIALLSAAAACGVGLSLAAQSVVGQTEVVLSLPAGNRPEGVAVHPSGDAFVGNRQVGAIVTVNEILRITPDGRTTLFATLPASSEGDGLLGLAVDPRGNVYGALVSYDVNHGIWRISADGSQQTLLPGSSGMLRPNALTFDRNGNLYATDSSGGALWRAPRGGAFAPWVADSLLEPLPDDPYGIPLPGANGIAFFAPDNLYVANSEQSLIARVRIRPDGSAGPVEPVTAPFGVPVPDGIVVDAHGLLYAVLPGFTLLGTSPLVSVDPVSGALSPIVTDPLDQNLFDTPLSLAFAGGRWGAKTVIVTNGDLQVAPGGPGPGVVQVYVGEPGFPAR